MCQHDLFSSEPTCRFDFSRLVGLVWYKDEYVNVQIFINGLSGDIVCAYYLPNLDDPETMCLNEYNEDLINYEDKHIVSEKEYCFSLINLFKKYLQYTSEWNNLLENKFE